MTTTEANRLIAEFMGAKYNNVEDGLECMDFIEKGTLYARVRIDNLKYHNSWEKLMLVVKKIRQVIDGEDYDEEKALHAGLILFGCSIFDTIDTVYHGVIQFIQWYQSTFEINSL